MFLDSFWPTRQAKQRQPNKRLTSFQPRVETLEQRECPAVVAPTGVQLSALSATQVKVTWTDIAGESGYRVYGWDGTKAVIAGTVGANVTTFTANNLQPNKIQWYIVESFDATSTGRSGWVSIMTPPEAITAPVNTRIAGVTQTSVTLNWGFASGALGYKIFQWDGTRAVQVGATNNTTSSFVVSNLAPGQNYYFYVQAYNNTNFASSAWLNVTTTSSALQTPANFQLQVLGPSSVRLSWNDVATENGYKVYGWNNSTSSAYLITTLPAGTTSYTATGLLPGRAYWFYVQAYNAFSVANTAWATATTVAAQPLQAPTNVDVVATGSNSVTVSWTEPARAVGYRVFYWTGLSWSLIQTVAQGTHQVPISGLASNKTHWFMIQAYTDGFAEVTYSSAVWINL